ncbi:AIPR family protein [Melioribacter sp. OK-6-Me]|uniref:AIPR family protein n=1 Tax=unclassified Melioribacter TaxID=2627329 RepID=UPI003EDB037D
MVTYEEFKKEWLEEITEGNPSNVELGNRFARKLLLQWLDTEDDTENLIFCDGSGDGGIDAAFLLNGQTNENDEIEGDTWYLIQSKYGKAFAGTDTILQESQKVIDTLDGRRERLNSFSENLLERLKVFRSSSSEKDKIILVFATIDPVDDDIKRAMSDVRTIGRQRLGLNFDTDSVSLQTIYQRLSTPEAVKYKIPFTANLVPSGTDLLVGSIKLLNLYNFLKEYRNSTSDLDLLYEKNVRKFLGSRRKVNKGIAETLKTDPEKFGLYNNGITIVVEDFKFLESDKYELVEPFVVNGCQTTRTIWETLSTRLEAGGTGVNPELEEWKTQLNRGIVVVKIVKVGEAGEELMVNTTRYTNSQNAVSQRDFIALESDFRRWHNEMSEKFDIYLEIQRGGWDSYKALQRSGAQTKEYKDWVNAFDLLKVYGAGWMNEPGLAYGKNPPFAPGGSMFKKIVERDDFTVDDLYAAYLLYKLTTQKIKFGRAAEKSSRGQTRHLFYYVIVQLLKECMLQASIPINNQSITFSIIRVFKDYNSPAAQELSEAALNVIDDYLLREKEDSLFTEPNYTGDLNAFLKWEKIGKGKDHTPKLENLITMNNLLMRKSLKPELPSPRETVIAAIKN